jgi:predicted ATPase
VKTNELRELLEDQKLEPFIRQIRFPQYKNIEPFTAISFTFPITAIVGANGTNKSSLLRALYGAPGYNNLGNFWFSTDTDPIEEGDEFPNCFIYSYRHPKLGTDIEVLKTRVKRENDPDNWEPSRPILRYKMAAMPKYKGKLTDPFRVKTRWNPIVKNVELIDFRHALSAFDRYFYYGNFSNSATFKTKKEFIRRRAVHLGSAIDALRDSYIFFRKQRIEGKENRLLGKEEVTAVSTILGRDYSEIRLTHHSFFNQEGYTARLQLSNLKYTEAFAGSGEFAVIKLVTQICSAPTSSLILLDEPEVSLHPGAQERLLDFLCDQVIRKRHQFVFTTHSPALIRRLPSDAIKVMTTGAQGEVLLLSQASHPEEAFIQIGERLPGKTIVLVEDRLAEELVKMALRRHYPNLLRVVEPCYYPGGVSVIFDRYLPIFAAESRTNILCLLDGDQRPDTDWPDDIQVQRTLDIELEDLIKLQIGTNKVSFAIDGGPRTRQAQQLANLQRQFLNWCSRHVRYLPTSMCPEQLILAKNRHIGTIAPKKSFEQLTHQELGYMSGESTTSDEIFNTQRRYLAMIPRDDEDIKAIADSISEFLAGRSND